MSGIKETPAFSDWDCRTKPTEQLIEMFVDMVQWGRITRGQRPAERPVFRKLHGVAHGRLKMHPERPEELRVGVFAHDALDAWIRFSSDAAPIDPDIGSTLGIAIKVFGVPGRNALGEDGNTGDFVLQNHPVFFVDDALEMCRFTYAGVVEGDYSRYLNDHPKTRMILDAMAKVEGSVLTTPYWGILPFKAGAAIVKYRLDPEKPRDYAAATFAEYLSTDLANRLRREEHCFRLMVQRRTNPETMPLDQATVDWPESESPYLQVATLVIPRQDITALGQVEYGQSLAVNIFRVPLDNAPVPESSLALVRKAVYAASAAARYWANGQPSVEIPEPRDPAPPPLQPDHRIVRAVIYPAVGVARVGNSANEWFVGPEVPDPAPLPPGSYRDRTGALKRQAARFRIYGVNARGEIVRELTGHGDDVQITWSVELANTKAAWYTFELALDIPEAASAPPTTLRNPAVADRSRLAIRPGSREVHGRNAGPQAFDTGSFMGKQVYLGEIFTDAAGRLLILGGRGHSCAYDSRRAITFANNDGWCDDISDGPVTARVTLGGKPLDVTPAWVVVAPPNYAPRLKSVRTMWDLMRDVAIKAKMLAAPARPSFAKDVLPIFQRLAGLQWVNAGFAAGFGWQGAFDLTSPEAIAQLSDDRVAHRELRRVVANAFRRFETDSWSPKPWPWLYGDAMNIPPARTPRQHATLSDLQLSMLAQWAEGDFDADYDAASEPVLDIDAAPLAEQGDLLTRAALDFCLADAFHPGCEMTWLVRAESLYMAPFRIAHAPKDWVAPDYGQVLTSDGVTIPNGPLGRQQAGDLTRWMAVPWQTDSASCRGGYDKTYDPFTPTFWPARVPNEVLTREAYDVVMDETRPLDERKAAFASRARWIAPLGNSSYTNQINTMINHFYRLAVVEPVDGPRDTGAFPAVLEVADRPTPELAAVERGVAFTETIGGLERTRAPAPAREVDLSSIEKVRRFPQGLSIQVE